MVALCGKAPAKPALGGRQASHQAAQRPVAQRQPHAISITPEREQAKTTNTKGAAGRCRGAVAQSSLSHGGGRCLRHVSPPLTAALHRARPPPPSPPSPLRLRSPPARLPSNPRYLPPHPSRETLTRSNSSIYAVKFLRKPRPGTWGVWCCGRAWMCWR